MIIRIRKASARFVFFGMALMSFGSPLAAKRTDDVVIMRNGDRFTGEIKKLDQGILYFKAGYMLEPAALDWTQVDSLESRDRFFVILTDRRPNLLQVAAQ